MSPEALVHLIVVLLVFGLVFTLLDYIIRRAPIFEPFRDIARMVLWVLAVIVIIVYVLLPLLRAV